MRSLCATLILSVITGAAIAANGPVDLLFGDLRVAPGYVQGGYGTTLGITFGDVGGGNRRYADFGYIMGFRGLSAGKVKAIVDGDKDNKQEMYALGFQITGGFGFCPHHDQHVEIIGGYGTGMNSISGKVVDVGNDGRYDQWLIEAGWYKTFSNRLQFGVPVGICWTKYRFDSAGSEHLGRANGLSAALSLGYRL